MAGKNLPNRGQPLLGGILGALIGGGMIGLVFGLNSALHLIFPDALAFSLAFLLVGMMVFGFTIWWRTAKNWRQTRLFAALYGVVVGGLLCLTFENPFSSLSLVTNAMLTGIFHATFYTLSFLIGQYFGGIRAAVWAAVIEGIVGYLTFVCVRASQSPWWIQTAPAWPVWGFLCLFILVALISAAAYGVVIRDDENQKG